MRNSYGRVKSLVPKMFGVSQTNACSQDNVRFSHLIHSSEPLDFFSERDPGPNTFKAEAKSSSEIVPIVLLACDLAGSASPHPKEVK